MANFSAKDVQELRKATGAGMMDAKNALTDADGHAEAAVQILREKGLAKASKLSSRENTEGLVAVATNQAAVALVHLKSETDFSAKSSDFQDFVQMLADEVLVNGEAVVDEKDQELEALKLTLKENIEVGTAKRYQASEGLALDAYLHGAGRAGVLIEASGVEADTLHEIALHVAFAKPTYLSRDQVSADEVEQERAALLEITKSEGKPEAAWDKIVEGRLNAWFAEMVLLEQGIFGDKEKVADRIGSGSISRFTLAMVG